MFNLLVSLVATNSDWLIRVDIFISEFITEPFYTRLSQILAQESPMINSNNQYVLAVTEEEILESSEQYQYHLYQIVSMDKVIVLSVIQSYQY